MIQLVGMKKCIDLKRETHDEMLAFYAEFFQRQRDIPHTHNPARCIGYNSSINEDTQLRFIGLEVNQIEDIPDGLTAWQLDDTTWKTLQTVNGRITVIEEKAIIWQWRNTAKPTLGEFALKDEIAQEFWLSANAYLAREEASESYDEVQIVEYDPAWPEKFTEFAGWLQDELGELAIRIEHIGSTAIPAMPAKPIIDIMIEIPSFRQAKEKVLPLFDDPSWEYWWNDRLVFIKREFFGGKRTHHIHMTSSKAEMQRHLIFCNYMWEHPDDAARYAALKRELSEKYRTERERYTEAKSAFIKEIEAKEMGEDKA